jgi:peptidoglycan lytic transglycosylase
MLTTKIQALGNVTQSRTALAFFAATLLMGGSVTEASARSHHHYGHRHHFHHHASAAPQGDSSWRDANASIASSGGRTFSGMASFYGNESGSKTASGQRFNQNAMTCAHRSLPFGTRLKVTHGDRSVVVTVNDRGPFIRGRVLDLSTAAARAVGLTSAGVGRVVAEVL